MDDTRTLDDAFAPPDADWTRVSPLLARAYRISLGVGTLAGVLVAIGLFLVPDVPGWLPVAVLVVDAVVTAWASWLIGRRVRSWGYAERADDLLVTSGILMRRLVVVPYGRMQLVDLVAGPIHRWLGLTTVQLHTAAATTDAEVCGLTPDTATRLRDRLTELGEAHASGL